MRNSAAVLAAAFLESLLCEISIENARDIDKKCTKTSYISIFCVLWPLLVSNLTRPRTKPVSFQNTSSTHPYITLPDCSLKRCCKLVIACLRNRNSPLPRKKQLRTAYTTKKPEKSRNPNPLLRRKPLSYEGNWMHLVKHLRIESFYVFETFRSRIYVYNV